MPDIKIDISQILHDYLIPILISSLIGLLCKQLWFTGWMWPIIISIGTFLIVELMSYLLEKHRCRKLKIQFEEKEKKERIDKIKSIAANTRVYFHSLGTYDKELIACIYKDGEKSKCKNERFLTQEQWRGNYGWLDKYQSLSYEPTIHYVACDNESERQYTNGTYHIVFDPLFYELLSNYIDNGIEDYPSTLSFEDYISFYFVNLAMCY